VSLRVWGLRGKVFAKRRVGSRSDGSQFLSAASAIPSEQLCVNRCMYSRCDWAGNTPHVQAACCVLRSAARSAICAIWAMSGQHNRGRLRTPGAIGCRGE
jgi:hypothetical protein